MAETVLITGGAGFIGSHLADELLLNGYSVRVLDNLSRQVHGGSEEPPAYLSTEVEFIHGDVRDPAAVRAALRDVSVVFHLAAAVGVGQSMYEIAHYTDVNNRGTAVLLEELIKHPVRRLLVASSMSIYGEGLYRDIYGRPRERVARSIQDLRCEQWDPVDIDGGELEAVATPESKQPMLSSVYALSKFDQERMVLMVAQAYGIQSVALRFFNVYGRRQSLSNPYTGVLAIFASRFLNDNSPMLFEDGRQRRDFVSVHDIVGACMLAMNTPEADGRAFNIGSGRSFSILQVANLMRGVLGKGDCLPVITGKYRVGDIRHCFADISAARKILGYEPQVSLKQGIEDMAVWLAGQHAEDLVDQATDQLQRRGLTI